MDVVWFAEIKWDYLRTRKQQLIRRRPSGVDVVFLEPFVRGRENHYHMRAADDIRVVTIPFIKNIPSGPARRVLDLPLARGMVDAAARARVRAQLGHAGVDTRESVFVISNVFAVHVAAALPARRLVYDCNDAHADFPGLPEWTRRYQDETFRRVDRVIVSARRLREDAVHARGSERDVFVVGNGVDYAAMHGARSLRARGARARARVGYLGAIAPWLDFDLLANLARSRPAWEVVLVGPLLAGAESTLERLAALDNVSVELPVSHDDVPRVLAGFDVGLIPFRRTPLTAGVNPNKLYEYLAAGLPVVSAPFSPEVEAVPDLVTLAEDAGAFASACERVFALCADDAARARLAARSSEIAAAHDWNRIAADFWARVCE
jgi:glycosyltransferase involved in cell wall biosynthesis